MKITTALMLVFMTCAYGSGKAQKVSLSLRNAKLEDAFKEITKQTDYKFLYNDAVIKGADRINVQIKNRSLTDALTQVLANNQLAFRIIDETITIKSINDSKTAVSDFDDQIQNTVTGVVRNMDGAPLAGASISVKGTSMGTTSDNKGAFSIQVRSGATLVIKYMGYVTKEVIIGNQDNVNITLMSENDQIEEVVVTGMGMKIDKRTFTGATSKVNMKDIEIGGLADPSRALEGRVAGVSVQNVSGTFGTAPKIRVRGATSIYGSSKPLWVVDGIIIEDVADVSADALSSGDALTLISSAVAGLNANDIESFQILKDGSATSVYGARGMAGVIVITTKKGTAGRSSMNYVGEFTTRAVPLYREFNIMNSQQQMSVYQEMYEKGYLRLAETSNASSSGVYGKIYEQINSGTLYNDFFFDRKNVNAALRKYEYINTDWFEQLFSRNIMQNHSVSLSSGTEKSQYYGSLSAISDPGWTKSSKMSRYTANLNANYNLRDNLKLNIITSGSYRDQTAPGTLGQTIDVVNGEVKRDFDINPYSYAMNTSRTLDPNEFYVRNYAPFNILHELKNNYMDIDVVDAKFQSELRWRPIANLELSALGNIRYQGTAQQHYIKDQSNQALAYRWMPNTIIRDANPYLYKDPENAFAVPISLLPEGGIYNRTDYKILTKDFRFTAQFDKTYNEKHAVSLFGAASVNSTERTNNWMRGWGMQYELGEMPFVNYLVFKRGQEENSQYYSMLNTRSREASFVGYGTYTYDGKYTLNGSLRYEGTNKLGKSRTARWMPTWNIAGAWNVYEEEFFKSLQPTMSHLTLKASYSLTGDRGPSFVTNSQVFIRSYNPWRPNTNDNESGLEIVNLENGELTYEKKHEFNFGLNAGFLNNRINVEFDVFRRNNFDLIGIVNTQGVGGEVSKYGNIAEMKSNGLELSVTTHNIKKDNFRWTSNINYTYVKNKITKLDTRSRVIDLITGNGFATVGRPVRALYSIPFKGLNNEGLPQFTNVTGDMTISGINFQEREKKDFLLYEGSTEPTNFGGFSNMFTYKDLSLIVLVNYSFGNVIRLNPVFKNAYSDLTAMTKEYADRWVVPGNESVTNIPTIASVRQNRNDRDLSIAYNAYNFSDVRTASGDFIRMKDVSLSYSLPKSLVSSWKLNSLSLRLNATNLFLIYADKKLNGQDPEFINAGGVAAPIPRQYTLTVKLGL